jgi:uncharacterized beta-barrel protein YwiB (DUF1934 family)
MENNKNYLINVKGIQEVDGENETVELTTMGSFISKPNGHTFIGYKEYDEENPSISSNNVVKVEGSERVTIIRSGEVDTRLILELGKRHQCHYNTPVGSILIGVSTDTIENRLSDNGGRLHVRYSLDFNNEQISNN